MTRVEVVAVIRDPAGLHARPAARLVEAARRYESSLHLVRGDAATAVTSMVTLLTMGLATGDEVVVRAEGPDADDAARGVAAVLEEHPGEAVGGAGPTPVVPDAAPATDADLRGVPASAGRAVGVVRHLDRVDTVLADVPSGLDVDGALAAVASRLRAQAGQADESTAAVLYALAELAADPQLGVAAQTRVAAGLPVPEALAAAGEDLATKLAGNPDPYLAARAADVRHIAADAASLARGEHVDVAALGDDRCILVATDVSPSLLSTLGPRRLAGIVTVEGSASSHASLIANSLGVPMVVALRDALTRLPDGAKAAIDGGTGAVELLPDTYVVPSEVVPAQETAVACAVHTADGHRIHVAVNVGSVAELTAARSSTVDGVGLYRTELNYLSRTVPPTEDELTGELRQAVELLDGQRLVVRTFDFGSDKQPPFMTSLGEPNPALGVRGIRLARQHPDLLSAQLRAVSRAARSGPVAVMAPMVTTVDDVRWFADQVRRHVDEGAGVEVGVMLEVPAAALDAEEIAKHVDFVSVGTNDLVQYLNAADRQVGLLAELQDPFSPPLLRLLSGVCRAARNSGTRVGICGAAAADPDWAVLAVGLGATELSVPAPAVARVRRRLCEVRLEDAQRVSAEALTAVTAEQARGLAQRLPVAS